VGTCCVVAARLPPSLQDSPLCWVSGGLWPTLATHCSPCPLPLASHCVRAPKHPAALCRRKRRACRCGMRCLRAWERATASSAAYPPSWLRCWRRRPYSRCGRV
jgi:hypothetical protein